MIQNIFCTSSFLFNILFYFVFPFPLQMFQRALSRYHKLLNVPSNSTGTFTSCKVTISSPSAENSKEFFVNGVDESYFINLFPDVILYSYLFTIFHSVFLLFGCLFIYIFHFHNILTGMCYQRYNYLG